jgi:carboxyl-terminal processing protease
MNQPSRRWYIVAVSIILAGCLSGGWLGNRASAETAEEGLLTFGRLLALVEDQDVGDVDSKRLVEAAIDGMLTELDPHSNYLDSDSFSEMRDEQRGKFHGLGIQITKRGPDKPLTIIAPIEGTPAWRTGLQSGDVISEIEGQPTIDMTVQQAVRLLKGDKGTRVTITIERPGRGEPFQVTIERDEIPLQSVRVAYMVRPDVGVVRIGNFNTTTAQELDDAVEQLKAQGMQKLILDLRGNPGGLLEQAVEVSERFIDAGQLIVYTEGRIAGSNQRFVARKAPQRVDVPLVVLVDGASASASEIVAGAIQDHDRGLVIGETTFGKGLVQRVIPIQSGEGVALAVTTAKYYTPSGRLIQRDYSDIDEYYLSRESDPEAGEVDLAPTPLPEVPQEAKEVFRTTSGRQVFGGGGITPDYTVKASKPPEIWFELNRENLLFDYAVQYVADHPQLEKGFKVDDAMMQDLVRFLNQNDPALTPDKLAAAREDLASRLRAQIVRIKWDQAEEARVRAETDPQLQRALELFDEAAALKQQARLLEGSLEPKDATTDRARTPLAEADPR